MATKNISRLTSIVLPAMVYVVTIALFLIIVQGEKSPIFWINLCYTLFLETAFFGWITWVRKEDTNEVSPLLSVIIGTYGLYYVIAGVVVMVLFSILHLIWPDCTSLIWWYVAALLVITVLWMIPAVFMTHADSTHHQQIKNLQMNTADVRSLSTQMKSVLNSATNLTSSQKIRLQQEIDSISPARINDNNFMIIKKFIEAIPNGEYDYLINEIKNIKSSL